MFIIFIQSRRLTLKMESLNLYAQPVRQAEYESSNKGVVENEEFDVQLYLDSEALMKNTIMEIQGLDEENKEISQTGDNLLSAVVQEGSKKSTKRKPSIFHNFHKHIITVIKKHCKICPKTFSQDPEGKAAYSLWQAFLKMKSCSKKIFNVIFGFSHSIHIEANITLLAGEFREFRIIKDKVGIELIVKAQQLIRVKVCDDLAQLSRQMLEGACRVDNFEVFFHYVSWFMRLLREGEVNQRITKQQILQGTNIKID